MRLPEVRTGPDGWSGPAHKSTVAEWALSAEPTLQRPSDITSACEAIAADLELGPEMAS